MSANKKSDIRGIIRNSARMYFAPLVAAIDTVRSEVEDNADSKVRSIKEIAICTRTGALTSQITNNPVHYKGNVWTLQSKPSTTLANLIEISYLDRTVHQR